MGTGQGRSPRESKSVAWANTASTSWSWPLSTHLPLTHQEPWTQRKQGLARGLSRSLNPKGSQTSSLDHVHCQGSSGTALGGQGEEWQAAGSCSSCTCCVSKGKFLRVCFLICETGAGLGSAEGREAGRKPWPAVYGDGRSPNLMPDYWSAHASTAPGSIQAPGMQPPQGKSPWHLTCTEKNVSCTCSSMSLSFLCLKVFMPLLNLYWMVRLAHCLKTKKRHSPPQNIFNLNSS